MANERNRDLTVGALWRRWAREDAGLVVIWAFVLFITAWWYPELPADVPIHWNWRGEPDGWAPKLWASLMMPGLAVLCWVGMCAGVSLDTRRAQLSADLSGLAWRVIRQSLVGFLAALHSIMLAAWCGADLRVDALVVSSVGVMLAAMGNVLGRVRPNHTVGLRFPWTLDDDDNWRQTHRFAAPLWVIGGLAMALAPLLLSGRLLFGFVLLTIGWITLAPALFSWRLFRKR